MIEVQQVEKTFFEGSSSRSLYPSGLNLKLREGQFHVITGRSGSGKSTLLNMIAGIESPDFGTIFLNNEPVSSWNEHMRTAFRRKHIGTVFQFFHLLPLLNVLENVLLPIELNKMMTAENKEYALDLLGEVGLADRASSYPDILSGGEKQRVSLVRALVHRPSFLLADEPTGNLDQASANVVLDQLKALTSDSQCTVIMVTHNNESLSYADNHIELDKFT
jgi:putative ABC transport system ATP-binding protein